MTTIEDFGWEVYEDKVIDCKGKIDVTDPCYDKDTWCRATVPLPPGKYACWYALLDKDVWGTRVATNAILIDHADMSDVRRVEHIDADIGVDASMCGFFVNKPDYDHAAWKRMCDEWSEAGWPNVMHNDDGFFTSSGYGDGSYDLYRLYDKDDNVIGLQLVFLLPDDDEDEEDEE